MLRFIFIFSAIFLLPATLFAHGVHGNGILSGFTHPILGTDHAFAILGIGFLAYLSNAQRWYVPLLAFVLLMIVGGLIGIGKEATWTVEKVIAASVVIVGLFGICHSRVTAPLILVCSAVFGFFHGFAHGAEMPSAMSKVVYISGYSLGALLLGTIGMLLARTVLSNSKGLQYAQVIGGVLLGCGLMITLG